MPKGRPPSSSDAPAGQGDLFGAPRPVSPRAASARPRSRRRSPPSPRWLRRSPAPAPVGLDTKAIQRGEERLSAAGPVPAPISPPLEVPARPARAVLTVGELTAQIKGTLERGFTRVIVKGEISGYRGPNARGHLYFNLKDAEATLDAKIWASMASRLKFKLRDGLSVVAEGSLDLYEPAGRYSLIVSKLEPEGEGALALAFQQLKERLAAEGLFGERRTRAPRPIPFLPRRIGVVTSRTGAALQDFLRVLHQRNPRLSVLLADARVQGEGSAAEVVRAIRRLERTDVDVIVVTRGGGSIEDLWAFNEEVVARAIFGCRVPVISAIGHEVDFTIADFVADLRCPTPSAAAEKLSPVLSDLELQLATARQRLRKAVERRVLEHERALQAARARLADPRRVLGQKQRHLAEQGDRLVRRINALVRLGREKQRGLAERLHRQQPQSRLAQRRQQLQKLRDRLLAAIRETLRSEGQALARSRLAVERASPRATIAKERRRLADRQSEARRARAEEGRRGAPPLPQARGRARGDEPAQGALARLLGHLPGR